ncbi:MAG: DMT family transporter [Clostridia bacterium]|nr:DMT family transporter [Clostridia bacterium]
MLNTKVKNQMLGVFLLLLAALIWGIAFVAQSEAMNYIGPFTMNGTRTLLATLFLFGASFVSDKIKGKKFTLLGSTNKDTNKNLLLGGIFCGIALTTATSFQQIGIIDTTVGKAGFLTTLYIVIVPLFGLFLGKKVAWNGWVGVVLATVGMFLLCIHEQVAFQKGDVLMIICAFAFAIHILIIDKYAPLVDGIRLSMIQFAFCAVISLILAFIFEKPNLNDILRGWLPVVYAGIMSAGVGYTLQIIGQKFVPSHIAPLLLSFESVFALLAGAVILKEKMILQEYFGCALVFIAVILAQITFKKVDKK